VTLPLRENLKRAMVTAANLKFANMPIPPSRVFYKRSHVFAMVVHNQILPGHIVLCLKQPEVRYTDISVH